MPVQELRLLRPEQGRADQLIEVLRADKIWKESHGASRAWASTLVHAGPATGLIAYFLDCEDSQSLGKALDEVRAARSAGNPPPLLRAPGSPGAPFTAESASIRVEITPNEPAVPEPPPPRIGFTSNLRANPGAQAALLEVLAEAQRFNEGLGVVPRNVVHRREAGTAPPTPPCGRR